MSWTEATEALATKLPGYEARAEQDRLALAIEQALGEHVHLLAEAGCGTGKSFANLVTAIDHSKATGKPVVVATATKALQDQYANKDLPFLADVLPGEVRYTVLKGRGNYACKAKLVEQPDVPYLDALEQELEGNAGHDGDLDNFVVEIPASDRHLLASTGEECPGKRDCPFGEVCFAEAAKERAQEAHVVIANHAVLMRDMMIRIRTDGVGSLLPDYPAVIIDEGHELEEYARSAFGNEFSQRSLIKFGDDVATFLRDKDANERLRRAARMLFEALEEKLGPRDNKVKLNDEKLTELVDELIEVLEAVKELRQRISDVRPEDDVRTMARKRVGRRSNGLVSRLTSIIVAESTELVRWIERDDKRGILLAYAPLNVGDILARNLWSHTSAVLTSATLSVAEDFSYIARSLGIENYRGFNAGTPFDFQKQSALYVPPNFPEPSHPTWKARVAAEMGELIRASGGRALLLFTSRRAMNEAYEAVAPQVRAMGHTLLKQGDAPVPKLAAQFKNDEHSVLFALKSFMVGADFQGDTCRLVILDKMPFPVPDDVVFQARCEVVDAQASSWRDKSFMALSVPIMALTLFQAHGRAIRTRDDEALIVIFDPRLHTKNYGKTILHSLPRSQRVNDLSEATAYLDALAERRGR